MEVKDEFGKVMNKRQLYGRLALEFFLPSLSSRAITINYLKYVAFIPNCFHILNSEWEEFVINLGNHRYEALMNQGLKFGVAQTLMELMLSNRWPRGVEFHFEPELLPDLR